MTVTRRKVEWPKPIPVYVYGGVKEGRPPAHVISVRDEDGVVVEQAAFHVYEGRALDAAIEAYLAIKLCGADLDGFLHGKLVAHILHSIDPREYSRPQPITSEDMGSARFIQWSSPLSPSQG